MQTETGKSSNQSKGLEARFQVRFPIHLRDGVKQYAEGEGRSMNMQIVKFVEKALREARAEREVRA